jgi:hypothetical protein
LSDWPANAKGEYVDPSKATLNDFIDRWERDWAKPNTSPKTFERYSELLRKYVRPRIGNTTIQKLRPVARSELYAALLQDRQGERGGLAPRTAGHVHRVLHRALGHAAKWDVVTQNVASHVSPARRGIRNSHPHSGASPPDPRQAAGQSDPRHRVPRPRHRYPTRGFGLVIYSRQIGTHDSDDRGPGLGDWVNGHVRIEKSRTRPGWEMSGHLAAGEEIRRNGFSRYPFDEILNSLGQWFGLVRCAI